MRVIVFVALSLVVSGCGGANPDVKTNYYLNAVEPPLSAPLSAGQSTTVHFLEMACRSRSNPQPGRPGNIQQLGCDAPFKPASLTVTVHTTVAGGPCTATAIVSAQGTVLATKTGPGDPNDLGYCTVVVFEPTHDTGNNFLI